MWGKNAARESDPHNRRAARRWRKRLALVAGGTLAGLLLVEVALRLAGYHAPPHYVPDEHFASRLAPGYRGWYAKEGRAWIEVNSAGFRDRERSTGKPPGTFRVAVLGDSYAEALQVDVEKTFWSVLERELGECVQGRAVEVLNFGISGFGTAQAYELLRHEVLEYQPDVVLLAFCTGNDVRNNSRRLEPDLVKPFYALQDGRLVLDASFREHPVFVKARSPWMKLRMALVGRSRLLQLLEQARRAHDAPGGGDGDGVNEPGLDDEIYREPADPAWIDAWEVTERLLVAMRDECRRHGAEFYVVTLANGIQVHADAKVRREWERKLGVHDLFYPERRLSGLGERESIPVITLAERMQRHATARQVYVHGFENGVLGQGHWNEAGHRLAGEWIAEALCQAPRLGTGSGETPEAGSREP